MEKVGRYKRKRNGKKERQKGTAKRNGKKERQKGTAKRNGKKERQKPRI